jgi:hypothetical protein
MVEADRIRIRLNHLQKAFHELSADPLLHGQDKSFALGCGILRRFLDEQWIDRHFLPSGKNGFLTLNESSPESREMSAFRLIDLSEVIYNLQDVAGFDDCIRKMRAGDIEGTYAELDFGRMLHLNNVPFRFVVPQGVKRLDYDIEILYPNGLVVCADAKCKVETTEFSENGVRNVLNDARKQLPKERPSIVFVKVPPRWIECQTIVASTIQVARRFLGGVKRIVSVKFYSSPLMLKDGMMMHQHAYKEVSNPKTDFGDEINWDIFKKFQLPPEHNGMPPHWQRILFFPDGKPKLPRQAKPTDNSAW